MNGKRIKTVILATLAMLALTACRSQDQKRSSSKATTSVSRSATKVSKRKTVKTSDTTSQSSSSAKESAPKTNTMNFDQIKQGNYGSLQGTWTETGHSASKDGQAVEKGGTDTLTVSNGTITNGSTKVQKQTLTDAAGEHSLVFKTKDDVLTANLADEDVAINWMVTFYPKGTTNKYKTNNDSGKNSQNMIVVWTSNNSYTEIFAQTSTTPSVSKTANAAKTTKATKPVETGLNLAQISRNNFSSLVGTWKNTDGKTIIVTNEVKNKPTGSNVAYSKGAVVKGTDGNGHSRVITAGKVTSGYIQGGIGTFDSDAAVSAFDPLTIIPKNVKLSDADDSDSTRDRLILGGGQGGYATQAYYKE
ncbi:Hypothetical protein ADU72_0762 [Pediococcus damnosus]|uniref:DUF6287 domain-containing protein n=1 Tax=Pediococcus damnosus TaxID=51663 RepID=A0A0R2HA82_9LACO|nr:DUF6287 domain-containing protein [Pediococcus damnosus]AMV63387.1 Hypothetical protein ADU70_1921 [Pediococcus damnosus]AMV66707.1 Hypothetical protein ADU72_0762 [Pediococcus damnosus]AMV69923.1 Hypothetical protein ADU73_1531 [Pediococcus damnosus]KJU74312.1 hypothetical protein AH70_07435 [Pediococcus damnosus LMG 28219]KRN49923.1 lipoprotein precursor [Pediococcus damnosus]